ncbi:Zinc finger protein, partial [Globisporangium splendens]
MMPTSESQVTSSFACDEQERKVEKECPLPRERTFICPEPDCNQRFHRKFTLREHLKTHTGERPYECTIPTCGKRFSTSGNLARHRRLHAMKNLACPDPDCTRVFTKQIKLERHIRVHMGSAAYACTVSGCTKTFSTSGNLTRHMRTQHRVQKIPAAGVTLPSLKGRHDIVGVSPLAAYYHHHRQSQSAHAGAGAWTAPPSLPTVPAVNAEGVHDHDLIDLLQCLFVEEASQPGALAAEPMHRRQEQQLHQYQLSRPESPRQSQHREYEQQRPHNFTMYF